MSAPTIDRPATPADPPLPSSGRHSLLGRMGGWSFDHRRAAVGAWLAAIVVIFAAAGVGGTAFTSTSDVPGSDSAAGFAALAEHFPELGTGGQSGTIVFVAEQGVDDPEVVTAMEALFADVAAGFPTADGMPQQPGATVVSPYAAAGAGQIADTGPLAGQVAFAQVNLTADIDDVESGRIGDMIAERAPEIDGLEVLAGGQYLATIDPPKTELIGLAFAVVVLVLAFGSVLAMGLPIAVALGGVAVGIGSMAVLSHVLTMPEDTTVIGMMVGLGVGIDYALFIVTRYRELVAAGHEPRAATVAAMETAGRAVVFAGATVVISMLGLLLVGLGWLGGMGIGVSVTVLATMLTSITLLPALLGFAHQRLELTRWRGLLIAAFAAVALLGAGLGSGPVVLAGVGLAVATLAGSTFVRALRRPVRRWPAKPVEQTLAHRWSRTVQRNPWAWLGGAAIVLAVLASPVLGMRLAWPDEGNFPEGTPTHEAFDLLAEGFGDGFNGPLIVTVETGLRAPGAEIDALHAALASTTGVAAVSPAVPDPSGSAFVMTVVPETSPQDEATTALVRTLRDEVVPAAASGLDIHITGSTATSVDVTEHLSGRMPIFFAAVLGMSFLVLLMVFRSVLVPLKAVAMNIASISAAYGVVVAVFQWGWGAELLGISGGPINPFIPLMLFAVVFGLSMDYEVFMLSRIREEYERTGDAVTSVADGLASTARVITAAAAIMVVVFGSFMFEDIREIKLFGFGLALAVFIDATLVRMIVVPAAMELLGEKNWWMPRWLDRIVPRLSVERRPDPAPTPVA